MKETVSPPNLWSLKKRHILTIAAAVCASYGIQVQPSHAFTLTSQQALPHASTKSFVQGDLGTHNRGAQFEQDTNQYNLPPFTDTSYDEMNTQIGNLFSQLQDMTVMQKLAALGSITNFLLIMYKALVTPSVVRFAGDEFNDDGEKVKEDPRTLEAMKNQLIDNAGWIISELKICIPSLYKGDMVTASFALCNCIEYTIDMIKYLAMISKRKNDIQGGEGVHSHADVALLALKETRHAMSRLRTLFSHEKVLGVKEMLVEIKRMNKEVELFQLIAALKSTPLSEVKNQSVKVQQFFSTCRNTSGNDIFSDEHIRAVLIMAHMFPLSGVAQLVSGIMDAKELRSLTAAGKLSKPELHEILVNNSTSVVQESVEYRLYGALQLGSLLVGGLQYMLKKGVLTHTYQSALMKAK